MPSRLDNTDPSSLKAEADAISGAASSDFSTTDPARYWAADVKRPRVRNASALGFASEVGGRVSGARMRWRRCSSARSCAGLSVGEVEAALEETFDRPMVSKSTVSRICMEARERYRAWCDRSLDEHDLVYCFLDAVYLKLRPNDTPAEGVLVTWAVTLEGGKVLLGLQLGSRESYADWLDFGRELTARGVRPPVLM